MLLDGKKIAKEIELEIQAEISTFEGRPPCLAVVLVGLDPASQVYVNSKKKACARAGIRSVAHELPADTRQETLLELVAELNADPNVDGILCQLPLPSHISEGAVIDAIDPSKDVDGFHPINTGKLLNGDPSAFVACTPLGIKVLLQRFGIETEGKHVAIIGRSNIVGKPLAALLMQNATGANATVTVLHSRSKQLKDVCRQADIVIPALGIPLFLKQDMVREGAVVVDVGMNRVEDKSSPKGYRIVGDADFDALKDHCSAITPVPGGVGLMTVAMLLNNTLISYKRRQIRHQHTPAS
ncbi:MAG: bifunctional methylenetetrahydrofolate dehydrogenase/methenyltetrahydrofolate cyclohydrolase FolD [Chlamydiia bacterium]|nr:bifunctional methylenetetrahydrofolate dehydrogenase/methenyltetrahydrofolate cyclohydrolase FolD [Chlamydiia bacterium]